LTDIYGIFSFSHSIDADELVLLDRAEGRWNGYVLSHERAEE